MYKHVQACNTGTTFPVASHDRALSGRIMTLPPVPVQNVVLEIRGECCGSSVIPVAQSLFQCC